MSASSMTDCFLASILGFCRASVSALSRLSSIPSPSAHVTDEVALVVLSYECDVFRL